MVTVLYAGGETIEETGLKHRGCSVPDYLKGSSLKHLARETIRKQLLEKDRHTNLFGRIPQLGLPHELHEYLLCDACSGATRKPLAREVQTDLHTNLLGRVPQCFDLLDVLLLSH